MNKFANSLAMWNDDLAERAKALIWEGMDCQDIAEALGVSHTTVRNHLGAEFQAYRRQERERKEREEREAAERAAEQSRPVDTERSVVRRLPNRAANTSSSSVGHVLVSVPRLRFLEGAT